MTQHPVVQRFTKTDLAIFELVSLQSPEFVMAECERLHWADGNGIESGVRVKLFSPV